MTTKKAGLWRAECAFCKGAPDTGFYCSALVVEECSRKCTFFKTPERDAQDRKLAKIKLESRGFRPSSKKVGSKLIVTTEKICPVLAKSK